MVLTGLKIAGLLDTAHLHCLSLDDGPFRMKERPFPSERSTDVQESLSVIISVIRVMMSSKPRVLVLGTATVSTRAYETFGGVPSHGRTSQRLMARVWMWLEGLWYACASVKVAI